jgi:5-methylcytosine-specific restriction endonuclease McrA
MSKAWKGGSTTRWRKIRAAVLERDQHRCTLRVPGVCTVVADQVHHLLPRAVAGDDMRYLVAACRACNLKVGEPSQQKPKRVSKW